VNTRVGVSASQDVGIGGRIRAARERRGWNREALAVHSGISWSAIAQVERGRRVNLRPGTLSSLAQALGLSIDYLVDGAPPAPMLEHRALLYETDQEFLDAAVPFLGEAAERGEGSIAVTSPAKLEMLQGELGAYAVNVVFAANASWYATPRSALEGYRQFLDTQLERGASWVRVVGEPVWVGRSASEVQGWTRYESLMNIVFGAAPASLICAYDAQGLDPEIVRGARLTHPHALEHATLASCPDFADPSTFALEH
jgi:transcriptional regulator with XRE-family HTH domain